MLMENTQWHISLHIIKLEMWVKIFISFSALYQLKQIPVFVQLCQYDEEQHWWYMGVMSVHKNLAFQELKEEVNK